MYTVSMLRSGLCALMNTQGLGCCDLLKVHKVLRRYLIRKEQEEKNRKKKRKG